MCLLPISRPLSARICGPSGIEWVPGMMLRLYIPATCSLYHSAACAASFCSFFSPQPSNSILHAVLWYQIKVHYYTTVVIIIELVCIATKGDEKPNSNRFFLLMIFFLVFLLLFIRMVGSDGLLARLCNSRCARSPPNTCYFLRVEEGVECYFEFVRSVPR